ncbi:MAG: hypothetical protein ABIO86_10500 [Sphingomonas sp.]
MRDAKANRTYVKYIAVAALIILLVAIGYFLIERRGRSPWTNRTNHQRVEACHKKYTQKEALNSCLKSIPFDGDWGVAPDGNST